jgi:hypothetical protein
MTEKDTVDRIIDLTVTITRLDAIAERFEQAMIPTEREALGVAIAFIDQVRAEAQLETGAYAVADIFPPPPEEPEPEPVPEDADDPVLEKARAALKPKPKK